MVSYKNCHNECPVHFHGATVATQLCGKNLGVAPKVNLWFYGTRQGKNTITDDMVALKDIYNQNKKGANIKIINISASLYRGNKEFEDIKEKLLSQGCYIIDSLIFGENFTCINKDSNTKEFYYSDWQLLSVNENELTSHMTISTGGKMTPLVTTKNDYLYCGQATYSWSIPKLAEFFALALQLKPDLTYDEFVDISNETKQINNEITFFNINGVINYLKENKKTR